MQLEDLLGGLTQPDFDEEWLATLPVGRIDIVVRADGRWEYCGSPFTRQSMVQLLASHLLLRDGDYCLVAPEQLLKITVEDCPFLIDGDYEVAGVFPGGAVYLHTRDRAIDSVEKLQGKRIATLDFDTASVRMVRHVGASVVGSNSANFAGKFNNGSVDLAYAPAVAYSPLELYKGVNPNGGVFKYALAYMNFQVIIHRDRFPDDAGQMVRDQAIKRIDEAYEIIAEAEAGIPDDIWMHPPQEDVAEYDKMLRKVRLSLLEDGVYDERAISLMKAIRCRVDGSRSECAS